MASTLSYTFSPPAYYPSSTSSPTYHPALHYRPSIPPDYLPNDEYRYLVKQQHRSRLEAHFAQPSLSSTRNMIPKTPYQKQGNLSRERRAEISAAKFATRAALGAGFDFTDEGFDRMRALDDPQRSWTRPDEDEDSDEEPIPARYIAEFNEEMRKFERMYDQDQHRSDDHASRHKHPGTYTDTKPLPLYKPSLPPPKQRDSGFEEKTPYEPTPQLQSKFSWDDLNDADDKSPKRRSFWFRHRRSRSVEPTHKVPEKKKKRRTW
ncbi:hypothetical protein J4E83_003945 [Alternaria metachromatica]|uniref:uncharacterized protein n=1 Tax=Alternaria metachromatica TaxID=283354 RepID=UPI0020C22167|nr:uncharacterized protein J4E83_003945 [Alternaria metachromatica]KAI4626792.1 hypothetical protein J4E83_003945 [Alternaria metachromatica]